VVTACAMPPPAFLVTVCLPARAFVLVSLARFALTWRGPPFELLTSYVASPRHSARCARRRVRGIDAMNDSVRHKRLVEEHYVVFWSDVSNEMVTAQLIFEFEDHMMPAANRGLDGGHG
jgi:hypothetical protein